MGQLPAALKKFQFKKGGGRVGSSASKTAGGKGTTATTVKKHAATPKAKVHGGKRGR